MNMTRHDNIFFSHQIIKINRLFRIQKTKLFVKQVYLMYHNSQQLLRYHKNKMYIPDGAKQFKSW